MTNRAKSILYMLIFSYSIWAVLSYVFLMTAIDDYKMRIEFREKIVNGECVLIDQYGDCWSAKKYQDYLEKQRSRKYFKANVFE